MVSEIRQRRMQVLDASGHVIITGGAGSGKTTIALEKAILKIKEGLDPEQKVLFLSFSRAAIFRLLEAAREKVSFDILRCLDIHTFHSFFWKFVRGHGYLLGAPHDLSVLPSHVENALSNGKRYEDPSWPAECERLFIDDGRIVFDLIAPKALELIKGSITLKNLISEKYPLVVIDEAQDTGENEWNCIREISGYTQIICLADIKQQIYKFREGRSLNSSNDIQHILGNALIVDFGAQNNRSSDTEIVEFANDILNNTPRGKPYVGVDHYTIRPDVEARNRRIRTMIHLLTRSLQKKTRKSQVSIGYLTRRSVGVNIISQALRGDSQAGEIPHLVIEDETAMLLSARVVSLCLEPIDDAFERLAALLDLIAEVYRSIGTKDANNKVGVLSKAAKRARDRQPGGQAHCPPALKLILEDLQKNGFSGNPYEDWLYVLNKFKSSKVKELIYISDNLRNFMSFGRGRQVYDALVDIWLKVGSYLRAKMVVDSVVSQAQLDEFGDNIDGISVMTIHKSKGREFDGVVLLHLGRLSEFSRHNEETVDEDESDDGDDEYRKLLHVGITRARHNVLVLTDSYLRSPLLSGHKLKATLHDTD